MSKYVTRNNGDYGTRINGTWYLYLADKGKLYRCGSLSNVAITRARYYQSAR